mgnify:CR=1 FL=1
MFMLLPGCLMAQRETDPDTLRMSGFGHRDSVLVPVRMENSVFGASFGAERFQMPLMSRPAQKLTDVPLSPQVKFPGKIDGFKPDPYPKENIFNAFVLNDQSWLSTARTYTVYPGLGNINSATLYYSYKVGNSLIFTGGVSGSKYILNDFLNNSAGVNGNVSYWLSDRIKVSVYGDYNVSSSSRMPAGAYPLVPGKSYGGSFEFKVTDKWGIVTGATREYDVFTRKWVTTPYAMPVFYSH